MKLLKNAALVIVVAWGAYLTWEVRQAVSYAGEACAYAASVANAQPGPGLDSQHRDVKFACQ
jgi:hypothetical protein